MKSLIINSVNNLYLKEYTEKAYKFLEYSKQFISNGDYCLDIGSSIGSTALPMAINGAEKVICFEPSRQRFEVLLSNIKQNNLENEIVALNAAASEKHNEKVKLFNTHTLDNGGLEEYCFNKHECSPEIINTLNISIFLQEKFSLEQISKIKFIKIDTEGADAEILRSLKPILSIVKPVIMVEWFFNEKFNKELFDSIEYINYNATSPEDFSNRNFTDFYLKKVGDLVLFPK